MEDIIRGSGISDDVTSSSHPEHEQELIVDDEEIPEHQNEGATGTWEDITEPETSSQEIDHPQKHVYTKVTIHSENVLSTFRCRLACIFRSYLVF